MDLQRQVEEGCTKDKKLCQTRLSGCQGKEACFPFLGTYNNALLMERRRYADSFLKSARL